MGLANSGTLTDLLTSAGCIRLTYTGEADKEQGVIGFIDNLPVETFDTAGTFPSVDQMMAICSQTTRLGSRTHEVVYRASPEEVAHPVTDGAWDIGESFTTPSDESKTHNSRVIGFAWSGVDATGPRLRLELIQVSEGHHRRWQNVIPQPPRTAGPSKVPVVQHTLDKVKPGWTTPSLTLPPVITDGLVRAGKGLVDQGVRKAKKSAWDYISGPLFGPVISGMGQWAGARAADSIFPTIMEDGLFLL
jgi:hypothetical protein